MQESNNFDAGPFTFISHAPVSSKPSGSSFIKRIFVGQKTKDAENDSVKENSAFRVHGTVSFQDAVYTGEFVGSRFEYFSPSFTTLIQPPSQFIHSYHQLPPSPSPPLHRATPFDAECQMFLSRCDGLGVLAWRDGRRLEGRFSAGQPVHGVMVHPSCDFFAVDFADAGSGAAGGFQSDAALLLTTAMRPRAARLIGDHSSPNYHPLPPPLVRFVETMPGLDLILIVLSHLVSHNLQGSRTVSIMTPSRWASLSRGIDPVVAVSSSFPDISLTGAPPRQLPTRATLDAEDIETTADLARSAQACARGVSSITAAATAAAAAAAAGFV